MTDDVDTAEDFNDITIRANAPDGTPVTLTLVMPDMQSASNIGRVRAQLRSETGEVYELDPGDAEHLITGLQAFLGEWAREVQRRRRKNWRQKP